MQQMARKFILTESGLEELKREYQKLVGEERPQVVDRIQRAREFGDLAENSEYDAAKEAQSLLEARIFELQEVLHHAQVIANAQKNDFVVIGSKVMVQMNDEEHEFTIVGSMEANPAEQKISNDSPVGKALLGLKTGEAIEIGVGPVKSLIKVLQIN